MSKNPVALILLLTLATLVAFVIFQISNIMTKSVISAPTQQQMQPLDSKLDTTVLEDLKKSSK